MTLCMARSSHFYRAKFIPQLCVNRPTIDSQVAAMMPLCCKWGMERKMINKLLGAAVVAAVAFAVAPASAAKMAGCSGENFGKTESRIETMADGEGKSTAQKEIAQAQEAMLSGKMGACSAHLSKAMHAGEVK
jgi:hypothetical protein